MKNLAQRLAYLKSRTVRFFAVYAAALWVALPELVQALRENLPDLAQYLPDNVYRWLSLAVIVGGLYYRVKTVKPLTDYKEGCQ